MTNLFKGLVLVGIGVVGTLIVTKKLLNDSEDDESYMEGLNEEAKEGIREIKEEMRREIWNRTIFNLMFYTVLPTIFFMILKSNKQKKDDIILELNYMEV